MGFNMSTENMKIDFAFYMAVANCPLYSEEDRKNALNQAMVIGMQFGYYPVQQEHKSEAAKAFIDGPESLPNSIMR